MNRTLSIFPILLLLAGCGSDEATPALADIKEGSPSSYTHKPQGPVAIEYRIIGAPIVGQPLAIDIEVRSLLGAQEITLNYRINDATAMEFTEAQPAQLTLAPSNDPAPVVQQVRLVPLREGRVFLNVSASVDADGSRLSTAIAIPIQVGAAPRETETNGTLTTGESGEPLHSLPASET
jgi:hypothetical protein